MIIQAEELKLIEKILVEEQMFMIQQDEEQEVIEPTQTAEQQNMIRQEEKSVVIGKFQKGSKNILRTSLVYTKKLLLIVFNKCVFTTYIYYKQFCYFFF